MPDDSDERLHRLVYGWDPSLRMFASFFGYGRILVLTPYSYDGSNNVRSMGVQRVCQVALCLWGARAHGRSFQL